MQQAARHSKPDPENEELRVQANTLRYELENLRQERDLTQLRHEKELRDLQLKADADFRKAQAAETASSRASHKTDALTKELKEIQESALNEKATLERRIRTLQEQNQGLQEDAIDAEAKLSENERQHKYQINELESVRASLQETLQDLQEEFQRVREQFTISQQRLTQREADVAQLETDNLRLRSEGINTETLIVLKRELSDQVTHIRNLESTNREQLSELRHLRKVQRNVEVVEEQKKSLENQLLLMSDLETELGNTQIQKRVLEDERRSWTSLLQVDGGGTEFESPEEVVSALVRERIEKASLVDKLGNLEPQLLEKDEIIRSLESDKTKLKEELAKFRGAGTASGPAADNRTKLRLERQRALAVKEIEYLRAQLKTFDIEELTMNGEQSRYDEHKSEQIAQLEKLCDDYRAELQRTHDELSSRETQREESTQPRGMKRPLSPAESDTEHERIAALSRKNRTLQDTLSRSEQKVSLLRHELEATKAHLKTLQEQSRVRILELRSNPTAEAERVKMSTLRTLQAENHDLLAQLQDISVGGTGSGETMRGVKVVPVSTLESIKLELKQMENTVAEKEKRMRRLKEIWTAKSSEFREAVASILGYKMDFLPNGRVRVTSMFHLSPAYRHGDRNADAESRRGPGSMGNGEENSIVFDGENGTMKISGGPNSLFALETKHLIKFWVEERKDIPCFLAAMTLEFYDKTTRAARA